MFECLLNAPRRKYKKSVHVYGLLLLQTFSAVYYSDQLNLTKMRTLTILGALIPYLVIANGASSDAGVKTLRFSGAELQNLADIVKSHGLVDKFAADQSITCNVAYTLALSKLTFTDLFNLKIGSCKV
jgi:hypothetical protein